VDCRTARAQLTRDATRLEAAGRHAVVSRARHLVSLSRAPRDHVARHRVQLHQKAREIRAASGRGLDARDERIVRFLTVLDRRLAATRVGAERSRLELRRDAEALERATERLSERRLEKLATLTAALNAHDPQRTLERGYALALGVDGEPLANAEAVRAAHEFDLRMADATLPAQLRGARGSAGPPAQPDLMQDSDSDAG
jgi:exodeoxyribonuclease VII large subunit